MTYQVKIASRALRDIDDCAAWMKECQEDFMFAQLDRIEMTLTRNIAQSPATWNHFFITGAPYRAYLFRIGRRTSYWIVYTLDEGAKRVDILRFWNASQDTREFAL